MQQHQFYYFGLPKDVIFNIFEFTGKKFLISKRHETELTPFNISIEVENQNKPNYILS